MDLSRVRTLKDLPLAQGSVVYWMSRDQRVGDNWALLYAQRKALEQKAPLAVVFCLLPKFLDATTRHYAFMLDGLREVESALLRKGIAFFLLTGDPVVEIPRFVQTQKVALLVTDFSPLTVSRRWKQGVTRRIQIPFHEVDAHNVVPCWEASPKLEFGAYTIRPKINRVLGRYLTDIPPLKRHPVAWGAPPKLVAWEHLGAQMAWDPSVGRVQSLESGQKAAAKTLRRFIAQRLSVYAEARNDPTLEGQSELSPYLHFGQIGAQRVALSIRAARSESSSSSAFLEELIIRRELSDNYCWYNPRYDAFEGFPAWAQKTLNEHRKDRREYVYELPEFEEAGTHDELWNAAQRQMVRTGKMHGYMRMYWAKKILEWTRSPEEALAIGIYLNDRFSIDGRDPNGYVGLAWSIGGVHDRAWAERPVFGKIRYMNANGCRRKFDVDAYVRAWSP